MTDSTRPPLPVQPMAGDPQDGADARSVLDAGAPTDPVLEGSGSSTEQAGAGRASGQLRAAGPNPADGPSRTDPAPGAPVDAGPAAPTRASAMWTAAVAATVVLLLLAIFVGQNTQRAGINFLWWHGHAPTSVLLLLAAVAGAALVIGAGIARILQLRHRGAPRGRAARSDRHRQAA